jgi:hypothetical protein
VEVEIGECQKEATGKRFVRSHPLLPQLDSEEYLKYGFEVRLGLELESLGLNHPVGYLRQAAAPFQQEIDELRRTIEVELLPAIESDFKELKENVPKFRQMEKRRHERQTVADHMMQEYYAKKRVKK